VQHYDRMGVIGLVVGLAAYLTGLQKAIINPVLGWFADLPTAGELAVIVALVALAVGIGVLVTRRRRAALGAAITQVDTNLGATPERV
jgi:hypothetical protein